MSFTNATFYVDDGLVSGTPGSDAARSTISAVVFDNPSTTVVRGTKVAHGLLTGMVVTISGTTNWNGLWKVTRIDADTFTLDDAEWASGADNTGDVVPAGGSSWADAWLTHLGGGLLTSMPAGCHERHARSPAPVSIGGAQWTSGVREGIKSIVSSTNASPIVMTITGHGWNNGDWVYVQGHATNTAARGLWRVVNKTADTIDLEGSTGNGIGGATGDVRRVTSSVVYLDTAQTTRVHDCDAVWTGLTGLVVAEANAFYGWEPFTLDDPGTGYTIGDVLTLTGGGGTGATFEVTGVGGGGELLNGGLDLLTHGSGYSNGSNYALSGGTGSGGELGLSGVAYVIADSGDSFKQGTGSFRVTRISDLAGTPLAYAATGTLDLSAYQKLTFHVSFDESNSSIIDDEWEICLCSDVAGATVVDVFKIPAMESSDLGRFRPMTLVKDGGGNLGASIRSVLVRAGVSWGGSTGQRLTLDNIQACTTAGLNLGSLITKGSAEQGSSEPCYAIQGIYGRGVMLDVAPGTSPGDGTFAPYYGTTENVTTYKREAIKIPYEISTSQAVNMGQSNGTETSPNSITGGWNVSTGLRTGETHYDGLSGEKNGIDAGGQRWTTVEGFAVYRFREGFTLGYDLANGKCTYDIIAASHCSLYGAKLDSANRCTLSVRNARNNQSAGLAIEGAVGCLITDTKLVGNQNNLDILGLAHHNTFKDLTVYAARDIAIRTTGFDNAIHGLVSADNADGVLQMTEGRVLFYDLLESNVADFANFHPGGFGGLDPVAHSFNHNNSGQDRLWFEQASGRSLATTRPDGEGRMWEAALDGEYPFLRDSAYPVRYVGVHSVAVKANKEVTLKAFMQQTHATNLRGRLVVRGGQLAGVDSDVVATLASNTSWQELEVSFTPTVAGYIEADIEVAYTAPPGTVIGVGAVNVDDVSSTQEA